MSTINIEKISICHWYADLESHRCGYCKDNDGAISYGMWAEQLTVEDYQNLVDRGWRRSGLYCYKPVMDQTCCPQYTIRCKALEFQLSKSQKKIIKKFNRYLNDSLADKGSSRSSTPVGEEDNIQEYRIIKDRPNNLIDFSKLSSGDVCFDVQEKDSKELMHASDSELKISQATTSIQNIGDSQESNVTIDPSDLSLTDVAMMRPSEHQDSNKKKSSPRLETKKGVGADPSKPPCKKAKLLRLEKKQKKLFEKGVTLDKPVSTSEAKSLEEFLSEVPENSKHKLKMKLIPTRKYDELDRVKNVEFQLFRKYQMAVHNDPPEKCTLTRFTKFLISTPLKCVRVRGKESVVTFGTFHQQYWLDDKLIAVAVLDILPRCVSSVYFFYDPDYRCLTLGSYGSLRELQFVRSLNKSVPSIEYYYMGFYIHSCPKMRYKGRLSYSFLLCPETYQWCPIEKCIPKLDISKYSRLTDDIDAVDEDFCTADDVDRIKVCVSYSFTVFGNYKRKFGEQEVFDNIGKLIGKKCAASLLFVKRMEC